MLQNIGEREMNTKPCCASSASLKARQLKVGNELVGILRLDEVMEEVSEMDLVSDAEIGEVLLERTKIYNYVPSAVAEEYRSALLQEYRGRRAKR